MKQAAIILAAFLLTACSSVTPYEELERQAFITGDWSAVEERERIIAKRAARRGPQCPAGTMSYCESRYGNERCGCVERDRLMGMLERR